MALDVLVLFAHPALEKSRINKRLLTAASGLERVSVRDLYELYPDLHIDVKREQAALVEHQVIVFQHPFYWYSVPPMLKQWQDLVLEHGWAYGANGHQLDDKLTFNALSAGGPEAIYAPEGFNRRTVRDFLAPWEATARLCRMRYLAPFVVHGTHKMTPDELQTEVDNYRRILIGLRDETINLEKAAALTRLNSDLGLLFESSVRNKERA